MQKVVTSKGRGYRTIPVHRPIPPVPAHRPIPPIPAYGPISVVQALAPWLYTKRTEEPRGAKMLDGSHQNIAMFCDFDGTITVGDVVDILLEQLADPQWRVIEKRWENDEIDDCECMSQQISLIRGDWRDIVRVLDTIEMDAHFKSFVEQCNQACIPIYVGSNGLDRVINYFFAREGIKVKDIWSYRLIESNSQWSLEFPHGQPRGVCQAANSVACKCTLLESHLAGAENTYRVVIGDSRSDFCWVQKADFVFAKSKLAQHCRDKQINHLSFTNFADINRYLI